ncbi:hypothetical protein DB32_007221 [Sandaracinus amylolyticus]|uniref:Uncharacterized protein n=1 Tax=Sandaracinus amylolyticus TaxID=927083 RepID=A0A0F6YMB3_9BACT|nr:hypothetical protein DB32_007221 [Sandaracinus amylolyticus]
MVPERVGDVRRGGARARPSRAGVGARARACAAGAPRVVVQVERALGMPIRVVYQHV